MNIYKILFIGLNNQTLVVLNKSKQIKIVGVSYFDYFDHFTLNPFNQLFRIVYKLHYKKTFRSASLVLLSLWNTLYFLSTKIYKENRVYLNCILTHNIEIIRADDFKSLSLFIKNNKIDLLIVNSWGIIENEVLNLPKHKTLNIHPSMLPQYRGALPTLWSLKNKDTISALSYVILNQSIDDGLIIGQHLFSIEKKDSWYELEKKIASILEDTLVVDILKYLTGHASPVKSDMPVSYTGYYNQYREIDLLNEGIDEIYNKVGLYPYIEPFFYCFLKLANKKIYIKKTSYTNENGVGRKIGEIWLELGYILFSTKDGILKSRLLIDISFRDSLFIIFYKIFNKI